MPPIGGIKVSLFNFFKKKAKGSRGRGAVSAQTVENVKRDWEDIDTLLKLGQPSQLRQALLKADRSLDSVLKDLMPGNTMGERLKVAKDKFEWNFYQRIWAAHKIRNSLVHEAGFEPPYHAIETSIKDLKEAINKLGVTL